MAPKDHPDLYEWLNRWWKDVGVFLFEIEAGNGPDHALFDDPWEWESIIFRAGILPDNVEGIDIRPLKTLVRAVAAFDEPGRINGPQPSIERLLRLSSVALGVYNRLHYVDALTDDEQAEPEPPSAKDSSSALRGKTRGPKPDPVKDKIERLHEKGTASISDIVEILDLKKRNGKSPEKRARNVINAMQQRQSRRKRAV